MKKIIFAAMSLLLSIKAAYSLQLASVTWNEFVQRSEIIAEARIVKTEIVNDKTRFTFEPLEIYKGPKVKSVTIVQNKMYDGPLGKTGDTCFIAMKKNNSAWAFAVPGRSFWPVTHAQTPDLHAIAMVGIDDHLIRKMPGLGKKKVRINAWLHNGRVHVYEAEVYLLEDVKKFLKKELR
ncbi:MAG: hypothetical protein JW838_12465 [Spirochaetes bacterium]|nr:hypothetical protein [Spirochaetota bacterium]